MEPLQRKYADMYHVSKRNSPISCLKALISRFLPNSNAVLLILILFALQGILACTSIPFRGWGGPDFGNRVLNIIPEKASPINGAGCPRSDCLGLRLNERDPSGYPYMYFDSLSEPFSNGQEAIGNLRCSSRWARIQIESTRMIQEFSSREEAERYFIENQKGSLKILNTEEWKGRYTLLQRLRNDPETIWVIFFIFFLAVKFLLVFLIVHCPLTWLLGWIDRLLIKREMLGRRSVVKSILITLCLLLAFWLWMIKPWRFM